MNKNDHLNQTGFTLVELVVVIVIFSILMFAIMSILRKGQEHIYAIDTKMSLDQSARDGLTKMIEEVRESAPSKITTSTDSLNFQVPDSVDENGLITWSGTIQYVIGGLDNTQLLRIDDTGSVVIANDLESIAFNLNDASNPTLVTIQMNLEREALDGQMYKEILTGQAKIRNE